MKLLCFLFFICVFNSALARSLLQSPEPEKNFYGFLALASIKDKLSGVPVCTGTAISKDSIVTTASCIFCDQQCQFNVEFSVPYEETLQFEIDSFLIYDEYELDPHKNDIGIIKIKGIIPDFFIAKLPDREFNPTKLFYYSAKFLNGRIFYERNATSLISNAKCTKVLNTYISDNYLCVYSKKQFSFQEQDQGTPLIYLNDDGYHILGTYIAKIPYFGPSVKIVSFQKIAPFIQWINKNTKNDSFSCSDEHKESATNSFIPVSSQPPITKNASVPLNNYFEPAPENNIKAPNNFQQNSPYSQTSSFNKHYVGQHVNTFNRPHLGSIKNQLKN